MNDPATAPRILHVDCDAFFVQVARLVDPEGAGRAEFLIVGGSPTGRGVVTSASYAARARGVRSAMPTGQALRLCPEATVVSVPRADIARASRRVRAVLEELAPVVEAASVDEFYLDLTGTERMLRGEPLEVTAERIRRTVLARASVEVSVGGGTNRLVAKMATNRAKPAGVHVVSPGGEADFVASHALADVPGVGPALLELLARRGLRTVRDALAVEPEWLERWLGARRAAWLLARLRGIGRREVEAGEPRKSISSERTFARDIDEDAELDRTLVRLAGSVASTLRGKELRARTVTVKLRDHDFRTRQRSRTLPSAVESDRVVREAARRLLADLRAARRVPARLLGVGLSGLVETDEHEQLALFGGAAAGEVDETERERSLSRLVDAVRGRFGSEAVVPGRLVRPPDPPEAPGRVRP